MLDVRERPPRVLVMDFGLARVDVSTESPAPELSGNADRLTRTGALVGTPAYMSPEQFAGAVADERSD